MNKFIEKISSKECIVILSLTFIIVFCLINRYEYTKYPNGKIHQRINKLTNDVETLCCRGEDFCIWRKGNNCRQKTISDDDLRIEIIIDRLVNGESIKNINTELEKYNMKILSDGEIQLINAEFEKSVKKTYDNDDAENYYK